MHRLLPLRLEVGQVSGGLAHQLRDTDARIVYVDLSEASMAVAKSRIEARGLGRRVEWIHGSLLDVPKWGLDRFDYVNCSGVLHHLADPPAGLAALRSVLKDASSKI